MVMGTLWCPVGKEDEGTLNTSFNLALAEVGPQKWGWMMFIFMGTRKWLKSRVLLPLLQPPHLLSFIGH